MVEVYFDILPDSSGWVCMVDGRWQHARYASFHEAESAGRRFAAKTEDGRKVVIRRQDLTGRLRALRAPHERHLED
ncbi:hypothetical protein J5J10_13155 [Ciceribacter sp. L1K23]|uniref:hypothetical protein n=1 Tax=unclassified Ciceribacter TaxID=2628820 RepID=UPI001ABEB5E7|nr:MULTISPECIES: hypothetical protein [unclassified Ciceribacter]MBO3759223.1 hypothetical protein [Ciceribacter sp. L1K22]MBR0556629.1 hypothetical protein [Ciceribacter sp. L1K23]